MSGALTICKLSARLVTPQGDPDAMARRANLQRDLTECLPGALGREAQARLGDGPGCAVIGKLAVDVSLVPGESSEVTASRWATAILDRLEATLRGGGRIFSDQAEHLAVYIDATADGRGNRRGALRPWAGFAAMPAALAIRAALTEPDAPTHAALQRLPAARRLAILNRLPPEEARLVLAALARRGRVTLDLSEAALETAAQRAVTAPAAAILLSLGAGASSGPFVSTAAAERFAAALMATTAPKKTVAGVASDAQDPPVGDADEDMPAALSAVLAEHRARAGTSQTSDPMRSPVAGLAMILPDMISALTAAAAAQDTGAARLRYDVLRAASGDPLSEDALLRYLAGVPPDGPLPPNDPALLDHGAALKDPEQGGDAADAPITPEHIAGLLLRRFASRLTGFENVSDSFLRDNMLCSSGRGELRNGRLSIRFAPPPICVVLIMAGCDSGRLRLPWLPGIQVEYAAEAAR